MATKPTSSLDSPALVQQSEHYPREFEGRVPRRVRLLETVREEVHPAMALGRERMIARSGAELDCCCNVHGAVSAFTKSGLLGLKPGEFEVIEWHQFPEGR